MWFNSFDFWIFLAVVLLGYHRIGHRLQNCFLLVASYFFYGCFDWRFLGLILFCTVLNYHAGLRIAAASDERRRRFWIGWSLVASLLVLCVFKYLGFFVHEASRMLLAMHLTAHPWTLEILLPAGISFFTFHALSYTIDVYRRDTPVCRSFMDFALFISFFPQLVAGPINRSTQLLPQVEKRRPKLDGVLFRDGLYLVMTGLFLKVVIADNMAWLANFVFSSDLGDLNGPEVLIGIYAFAFQIYGDFAGYSAIAIGVSKWLGFELMENFRRPYFAANPREFWQRWHISLSTWLRDYLYIPLGGNRGGEWKMSRNLILTMLLGGLWHGAAWTFVVWGGIHGFWLVLHRKWVGRFRGGAERGPSTGLRKIVGIVATFHLVCLAWVFFRADSTEQAVGLIAALGSGWHLSDFVLTGAGLMAFFLGPWLAFEAWQELRKDSNVLLNAPWPARAAFYLYVILMLLFFAAPVSVEFIYFQF
jgi:alginate O-acetyltransferase complex protein AlgI